HRAARPLLGGIEDHAVAAVAGILHDEWRHAGEDLISDFALLALEIFLRVLGGAIETLLLDFDLLDQLVARFLIQLVLLGVQLLLEAVDFVGQALQLVLLGFKFLAQRLKIAPSFVRGKYRLFDVDGADFGSRGLGRHRSSSRGRVRRGGSRGSAGSGGGLGQSEEGKAEHYGNGDAGKLLNHLDPFELLRILGMLEASSSLGSTRRIATRANQS